MSKETEAIMAATGAMMATDNDHGCEWRENDDGSWDTTCGRHLPAMPYCPHCGSKMKVEDCEASNEQ